MSVVFIILQATFSFALSPAISNGLSYLHSSQTSTGYWGAADEVPFNTFVNTCAVSDTLKYFSNTDITYASAVQWISSTPVNNSDYLISQLLALSQTEQDAAPIRDNLLSIRNGDGWGVGEGLTSDIKRTALALQALKAVNYSDYSVSFPAMNFLTTNQNADGGWGFASGDVSNTYVTSIVLRTLSAYNSVFINQNSINKASAFLLTHQNTDGGFGNSPSTVYDTATALMSLIESGQGSTQAIQSGINYLAASQLDDGSWNDDPYSTALALQALAEARPNLAVSTTGITFSNSMPQSGATTTISAAISSS